MNIIQVEQNIGALLTDLVEGRVDQENFIYELLLAYGHRKQSVSRLRSGERNMASKNNGPHHEEIIWKRHLYFKHIDGDALHSEIDQMRKEKLIATNKIRFIIVTNFDQLLAVDTKTSDSLDINLDELPKQFDFFLPWAGMEKAVYQGENPADVKAAEKMAKLFDLIKGDNFDESNGDDSNALHKLNVFLTRLLFCYFAEDTDIFTGNQFSLAIKSHTKDDGSDLSDYLNRLFTVLNTADSDRGKLPDYLANFPYVNGGLFADDIPSPVFSAKSRRMLIECGSELDWSDINPDIFGSMIQAVVHPDKRGAMGMHYTSVTNIMKVIEPLFLNDLYEELEKVESSATKLQNLQQRLGEIKIFDPACGSGNFLIVAYKELCKLEIELLKRLQELELQKTGQIAQPFSVIKLSQLYGIELDDFAHEVAILSLWLVEHQMNIEFKVEFGESAPSLPLTRSGNIICGNATRVNWRTVCDNSKAETYMVGNPPYLGESYQSKDQKSDMDFVFSGMKNYKKQDYIACWFFKSARYINENTESAFVSTSSVCQGIQTGMLWPHIFDLNIEISFCHQPFQWKNNARDSAGVYCIVVGLRYRCNKDKFIYDDFRVSKVSNISPYLIEGSDLVVRKVSKPIFNLPVAMKGNGVYDGGNFMLTPSEKKSLEEEDSRASKFLLRVTGTNEFIKGVERWCIWIDTKDVEDALSIQSINKRIKKVKDWREFSGVTAQAYSSVPYRFKGINRAKKTLMIIPAVSSDNREYIPMALLGAEIIVTDLAFMILDPELYVFSLLNSAMHQVWVKTVTGRLGDGYRYSLGVCYNSFPLPEISQSDKEKLAVSAINILSMREAHPDKTLFQLYAKGDMPEDLLEAHRLNDELVDGLYGQKVGVSNNRLKTLFGLYLQNQGNINA